MKIQHLVKILSILSAGLFITWACKSTSTLSKLGKSSREFVSPVSQSKHSGSTVKRTAGIAEVGPLQANSGFPAWYKDVTGNLLEPCYFPDPMCLPPSANFNTALPMAFPDNFSDEIFYFSAASTVATAGGGEVAWEAAIEGAFANEIPLDGERLVFGRIRIRGSNLQPGNYRITHPYGVDVFNVTDAGPNGINFTEDIAPVAENFSAVMSSRVGPFLKWDPASSDEALAGYLGDPGVPHTVAGSPFGTNYVRVERIPASAAAILVGENNLFAISGRKHKFAVAASHVGGDYNPAPSVKLAATLPGSTIKYSIDGSDPAGGVVYTSPISLPAGLTTLKFIATHPVSGSTAVQQVSYKVDPDMLAVGLGATAEGMYTNDVNVTLQGYGGFTSIKYTLDGTDPSISTTAMTYSGSINLTLNGIHKIRAVALRAAAGTEEKSIVRNFVFTIKKRHTDVGPINVANGFPYWFKNLETGLKLQPCLSLDETQCLAPGVDVAKPIVFPSNFPDELFYWTADALGTFAAGGTAQLILAVEGAFANENVVDGDQAVFGRIRIRIDTPTAGFFRVTHPFGVEYFNVDAAGRRSINYTEDIDIAPGAFAAIETGRIRMLTPVLDGPTGFISNALVPTGLKNSPAGTNVFKVERLDGAVWTTLINTSNFTVTGQIASAALLSDIHPASKTVNAWPTVKMSASEDGATIYYTTDGSDPFTSSSKKTYVGSFIPAGAGASVTIKSAAVLGAQKSSVNQATYTLDTTPPVLGITPASGTVTGPVNITFTKDDPAAVVFYTLDSTDPRDSLTRNQAGSTLILDPNPTVEMRAVAQDVAGNFSGVVTRSYTYNSSASGAGSSSQPPTVANLGYALTRLADGIGVILNWSGVTTDGSITRYYLEESLNGGPWSPVTLPTFTTLSTTRPVLIPLTNSTMKFRVRADSSAGLSSAWNETPLLTLSYTPETVLTQISYNGNWTQISLPGAIGGSSRRTIFANDRSRFEFAGISLVVLGSKSPNGALVGGQLDGRLIGDIDTSSPVQVNRFPIIIQNDLAAGRRRIELFNRSAGREFVLDGFLTLSAQ
jgi:hypothetical protein